MCINVSNLFQFSHLSRTELEFAELLLVADAAELVEDVVVSLVLRLEDHPRLLQQVRPHVRRQDVQVLVEVDLDELA